MDRITYHIMISWRDGEALVQSLSEKDFEAMRRRMIDEGFSNLQCEWYESGSQDLPDRIVVFVYWEEPDNPPEYSQVQGWGREAASSHW
jgi:hypothetical protein